MGFETTNSLRVITGVHIIEYLSVKRFISLCNEAVMILKFGDIALFEITNLQNVIVVSYYFDVTHRNPFPVATG